MTLKAISILQNLIAEGNVVRQSPQDNPSAGHPLVMSCPTISREDKQAAIDELTKLQAELCEQRGAHEQAAHTVRDLRTECLEQARLVGMGAERELALRAKLQEALKLKEKISKICNDNWIESKKTWKEDTVAKIIKAL